MDLSLHRHLRLTLTMKSFTEALVVGVRASTSTNDEQNIRMSEASTCSRPLQAHAMTSNELAAKGGQP